MLKAIVAIARFDDVAVIGYLCRLRAAEVQALKVSDIRNGCIRVIREKGSKGELTRISPRLQRAIDVAKAWNRGAPTPIKGTYLIHDKKGQAISKSAFSSAWIRIMKRACEIGIIINGQVLKLEEPFTFHDIEAKVVTDHTEHESGHLSKKARETYIRKLQEVDATR